MNNIIPLFKNSIFVGKWRMSHAQAEREFIISEDSTILAIPIYEDDDLVDSKDECLEVELGAISARKLTFSTWFKSVGRKVHYRLFFYGNKNKLKVSYMYSDKTRLKEGLINNAKLGIHWSWIPVDEDCCSEYIFQKIGNSINIRAFEIGSSEEYLVSDVKFSNESICFKIFIKSDNREGFLKFNFKDKYSQPMMEFTFICYDYVYRLH